MEQYPTSVETGGQPPQQNGDWRSRITAFYQHYQPSKLEDPGAMDNIMKWVKYTHADHLWMKWVKYTCSDNFSLVEKQTTSADPVKHKRVACVVD